MYTLDPHGRRNILRSMEADAQASGIYRNQDELPQRKTATVSDL